MLTSEFSHHAQRVRRFFYRMAVQSETVGLGQETAFDFKYVPQLGLTTSPGGPEDSRPVRPASSSGPQSLSVVGLVIRTALVGTVVLVGLRSMVRLAAGLW